MNVFQYRNWHDALRMVQKDIINSRNCKDHSVWQSEHGRDRVIICLFKQLVKIWTESNACSVRFDTWKHEGRFIDLSFEKSIDSIKEVR